MFNTLAIIGIFLSVFGAITSLISAIKIRRKMKALGNILDSKAGELSPSPDVEDPEGRNTVDQISDDDDDQGDR
ncbi:MAG: hypothetical protein ABF623_12660 [Gluconobacter cerinus]|uniref:hypothetical protein n=1 Tax=Gluconobacter cerinus TaxID=38307 RepID=UPI0039E9590C